MPEAVLSGNSTMIVNPAAFALDTAGNVYVANAGDNRVLEFSTYGNVAPSQTMTLGAAGAAVSGIAVNRSGTYALFVSSKPTAEVDVFSAAGSLQGKIAGPGTTLSAPAALAVDRSNDVYIVDGAAVKLFTNAANGSAGAPNATIAGSATTLNAPAALALDSQGDMLVADGAAVKVFSAGSSGNVAPAAVITGAATGLKNVTGVAVDGAGAIWASDGTNDALYRFAPGARGNVPPLTTIAGPNTTLSGPVYIQLGVAI